MEKMLDLITGEVTKAFIACGYDEKYARVTLSNRPDLCEYQCNGALAAAKEYHCAPFMISDKVAEELKQSEMKKDLDVKKQRTQRRSSLITADRMLQNRCMSDTYVLQLSVRVSNVLENLWDMR